MFLMDTYDNVDNDISICRRVTDDTMKEVEYLNLL